jgi:hypothetical protein
MSSKRMRLQPIEAQILGKNTMIKEKGRGTVRAYLNEEEQNKLSQIRESDSAFENECKALGIEPHTVSNYWYKGKHFSIHTKPNQTNIEDIKDDIISQMNEHSPKYKKVFHSSKPNPHLLVIDPADIHVGKLATAMESGEEYNMQIAVQRVLDGVQGILDKSKGFHIDQILLVGGNDVLHIDSPSRKTTSGTPQDTDGMWYENFMMAKQLYVDVIEMLATHAPLHFVFNPSNHDYMSGFFLADVIKSWFRQHPHVSFDTSVAHRKYFRYGNSLIGTTHGDGAKNATLPILMAQEAPKDWAFTKHRYIYTHHLHHKIAQDVVGVTIEALRSPSATDSWHHRNGYQHAPKAVEGFLHHPEHGQVARLTHIF